MANDFLMQKFDGIFATGAAYKGIGGGLEGTAGDFMTNIGVTGHNWLSPEFHELHGNMLNMTNYAYEESEATVRRGDATIGCGELGQACSSKVTAILSAT